MAEWSQHTYENSISSRCWWCTSYGDGWPALGDDPDMKHILALEQEAAPIPPWAARIVERAINFLPPCGHYRFPQPQLEILQAIGSETAPEFVHGCYTVDPDRKRDLQDYCLCLDAWLAGASPEPVARELIDLGHRRIAWDRVCADLWQVLGGHSPQKDLLVERLLHRLRWWTRSAVWDSDLASEFARDQYLGDYSPAGGLAGEHSYSTRPIPDVAEQRSSRIVQLEAKLDERSTLWPELRPWMLEEWWLCAPKAFRFLERLLWQIGKERQLEEGERVPGFLLAQDTCPNPAETSEWWTACCAALEAWQKSKPLAGDVASQINALLGTPTPVKNWLVALFLKKSELLATWKFGQLVGGDSNSR